MLADSLALICEGVVLSEVSLSVLLHVHISLERPVANCNQQVVLLVKAKI